MTTGKLTGIVVLATVVGAVAGAQAWQYFFAPFALEAAAGEIASELSFNRAVLETLDKNNVDCARQLLLINLDSSLRISVPGALQWRIDERFHQRLREKALETKSYLDSHGPGPKASCSGSPQSNPTPKSDARKFGARRLA